LPRSRTSSPATPKPNPHPPTLSRGGLQNLDSYDASITIPPSSGGRMSLHPPWPVRLGPRISRLSKLPRESPGRSFWPTLTPNQSGMLERCWPAEPRIVSPCLRTPPPPPKLTIHFYNISSLLPPLLLLLSCFLRLRTSPRFYQQKCPPHFKNLPTRQPLALVLFLTLPQSRSTRPTSGSFHLCSLPSSTMGTTPCHEEGQRQCPG